MNRFAALLDRLAFEHARTAKVRLMSGYFRTTSDPERGYALAALTGALTFRHAKPALIRALIAARTDPVLFALSYDHVGDLSETVALMWPAAPAARGDARAPSLSEVVDVLSTIGKAELPARIARWLDVLDETGRWALLKFVTGALRVGVSARLAKTAVAAIGDKPPDAIELIWPGLAPPYTDLFAWLEGRAEMPATDDPAAFRPMMLAHALDAADLAGLDPAAYCAEWKWDGIRVQAVIGRNRDGARVRRLYSRTGEDITASFPELADALEIEGALDGELLVLREQHVQPFNVLQQRLNRKSVTAKLMADYPVHLFVYDLLDLAGEDLRVLGFLERRQRLEALLARRPSSRLHLSPLVPFSTWDALAAARADPLAAGAGENAEAIEGIMLKQREAPYLPGRPRGLWWKWKRDPFTIDAVLMYAQRGHGKRSSYYSDYTFGVWMQAAAGLELVPVGKAYFGFTDVELSQIDRFIRRHTINRFGPVREVIHEPDQGLVLEVAFEGLQHSTRHRSGIAMRFPRISRLRWDKPPREADHLDTLFRMLAAGRTGSIESAERAPDTGVAGSERTPAANRS